MNNSDNILDKLHSLGLGHHEARLYMELLKEPASHLRLAQATGINRTKVYRLADELEKRSLITKRIDDRGAFLVAADPSTLEVAIVSAEEKLKQQRLSFAQILPDLQALQQASQREFVVNTYEGVEGFKQMLWHELKTKQEILVFVSGEMEVLVPDHRWTEKHRAMTLEAGYKIREILNPNGKPEHFTENDGFMHIYRKRILPVETIYLEHQIVIYNDTVATYHWRNEQKIGFEVVNKAYATMWRQMFEQYWQLAALPAGPAHAL